MAGGCACGLSAQLGWLSPGDSHGTGQSGCHGIGQGVSHGSGQDSCHSTGQELIYSPIFPACFWTVVLPPETLQPCSLRGDKIADLDPTTPQVYSGDPPCFLPLFFLLSPQTSLFLSLLSCPITHDDDFLQALKIQIPNTRTLQGNSLSFFFWSRKFENVMLA